MFSSQHCSTLLEHGERSDKWMRIFWTDLFAKVTGGENLVIKQMCFVTSLFTRSQASADRRQTGVCLTLSRAAENLWSLPLQISLKDQESFNLFFVLHQTYKTYLFQVCEDISSSAQGLLVKRKRKPQLQPCESFGDHILSAVLLPKHLRGCTDV